MPTTIPVCVIDVTPDCMARAMPKSMTLTTPRLVSMTLPGLMSRCTRPTLWLSESAASTSPQILRAFSAGIAPNWATSSSSTVRSGFPSTYSMTMYGTIAPSIVSSPESKTETMLVWFSLATAWASRRKRSRKEASRPSSECSVLTATGRSSTVS